MLTFVGIPLALLFPCKLLQWLKVIQSLQYKVISIAHNLLHKSESAYLRNPINIKSTFKTRSLNHICLSIPPITFELKFSDNSFGDHNSSISLWNSQLISDLSHNFHPHQPYKFPLSPLLHSVHSLAINFSLPLRYIISLCNPIHSSTNLTYPSTFNRSTLYVDTPWEPEHTPIPTGFARAIQSRILLT